MKTQHLFASATVATMLAVTVPAHAQLVGGWLHGGFGGGFGGRFGAASGAYGRMGASAGGSLRGSTDSQLEKVGRAHRSVEATAQGAAGAGTRAAIMTEGSVHHDLGKVDRETRRTGDLVADSAQAAAASVPQAGADVVAQGEAAAQGGLQGRELNAAGAGAVSTSGTSDARASGPSGHSSGSSAPAPRKPDSGEGTPRTQSPPMRRNPDTRHEGATEADASADVTANASMSASASR